MQKREVENSNPAHKEEIRVRRMNQAQSLQRRLEAERDRKHIEVMKIKQAIHSTMQISRAINEELLQEKRDNVDRSMFKLNDASSTMVSVPSELTNRLHNAKR